MFGPGISDSLFSSSSHSLQYMNMYTPLYPPVDTLANS